MNFLRKCLSPTAESGATYLHDLIDPEVMADMIIAKLEKKISCIPYAKVDTTLQGRPGTTIKVPTYIWDGEAVDVPEGEEIPIRNLSSKTEDYTIKKAGIGTIITDEALESGMGDPIGVSTDGIAKSILVKTDVDAMACYLKASTQYDAVATGNGKISYANIVNAIDLFEEEVNTDKIIYVHPHQITQLRLDPDFISKEKYGNQVMIDGEIGIVANARVVPSKRVVCIGGCYYNPIIKTNVDDETELEVPAITYFLKRNTNIEKDRKARNRLTEITGDQMFVVALTNDTRVVLLKTSGAPLYTRNMYEREYKYPGTDLLVKTEGTKATLGKTADNTYTLNIAGEAPVLSADARDGLGYDAKATHNAVVLLSVPDAPLHEFNPANVIYNGKACTAGDICFVGSEPYFIIVRALWKEGGKITGASESFTLKYGEDGTTHTFTWGYKGLNLA